MTELLTSHCPQSRNRAAPAPRLSVSMDAPPVESAAEAASVALPDDLLGGGEMVLLAVKPSIWRPLLDSLGWIAAAAVGSVAVAFWELALPRLSVTLTVQLVLLLAAGRFCIALMRWAATWYLLTNRRIIHMRGVRRPGITSCLLVDIRGTDLGATLAERALALGTITIETCRDDGRWHFWRGISQPEEVHRRLRRAIRDIIAS